MTEYFREFTPPVPPVVKLRCSLTATRSATLGQPGGYVGPPTPDDIRGWLEVQTAEYRQEAIGPVALTAEAVTRWYMNATSADVAKVREMVDAAFLPTPAELDRVGRVIRAMREWVPGCRASLVTAIDAELPEAMTGYAALLDLRDKAVTENAELKSQLSAAIAERQEALDKIASMERENDGWIAMERELREARETIRKLEEEKKEVERWICIESGQRTMTIDALRDELSRDSDALERLRSIVDDQIGWANDEDEEAGNYEARLREVAHLFSVSPGSRTGKAEAALATANETIRALTEERDRLEARAGVDANRIRRFESREAPGEEWKRAQDSMAGALPLGATPYEPPRSEEGRPDHRSAIAGALAANFRETLAGVAAENVRYGMSETNTPATSAGSEPVHQVPSEAAGPTRLAPLTDRERSMVAAAEAWGRGNRNIEETIGEKRIAELNLLAAIDLPKTPDVPATELDVDVLIGPARIVSISRSGEPLRERSRAACTALSELVYWSTADSPKTPDVRREEPYDGAVITAIAHMLTIANENDDLDGEQREAVKDYVYRARCEYDRIRRELRLATEQVEALSKVQVATKAARELRRDDLSWHTVPERDSAEEVHACLSADLVAWQASDEYESWLKSTGAK